MIRFAKYVSAGFVGASVLALLAGTVPARAALTPASLPLYFEANQGQADAPAQFIARGSDSQFLVAPGGVQFNLFKPTGPGAFSSRSVRMQFIGADPRARISGMEELAGKINYLVGSDSAKWQTGVPTFAQIQVEAIYPGVNLAYYGNQRQLEYDFSVAPGADPGVIAIRFEGTDKVFVSPAGELVLTLGAGEIRQPKPVIYQIIRGARQEVSGGYKLLDAHTVAFAAGSYDRSRPLVIDPILSYSTYFGGTGNDVAKAVAVDTNGFVYMAGQTLSAQLATSGAFQTNFQGGKIAGDAFVAKFGYDGTNLSLVYCTYLGGSGDDAAYGLKVDAAGDAYIAGATDSTDFPTKNAVVNGAYSGTNVSGTIDQYSKTYSSDAFVAELNPGGSNLVFSTYLGGAGADAANGIAIDAVGNAYITGFTYSTNFPITANAFQKRLAVTNWAFQTYYNANAFVAEISAGGSSLVYSTYLGGTNYDEGKGIALDGAGDIYVTGFTVSTNFPVTNAISQIINGKLVNGYLLNGSTNFTFTDDAFVAEFAPAGTSLVYSTLLGGVQNDVASGIAVDGVGNAYVTGWTVSTNFPDTVVLPGLVNGLTNDFLFGFPVFTNAFLTQVTWNGTNAVVGYSAVFGGTNFGLNIGYGVAVDPAGDAFVCGATSSPTFPVTTNNIPDLTGSLRATNSGAGDAFVIGFSTNASSLLVSAYLGGAGNDSAYGIALDLSNDVYIAGQTFSSNFPTNHALHATLNGTSDAFLVKIVDDPPLLSLAAGGGHGQVSWNSGLPFIPELARLFRLETSTNLFSTNWVPVPQSPVLTNNRYAVTFNPTNRAQFFRLHAH